MKFKDIFTLVVLAIILIVIGSIFIDRFGNSEKRRTATVEVVAPINPEFNSEAKVILLGENPNVPVSSFSTPVNLSSGFGNNNPFTGSR